jgi:hypothetical protein
MVTMMITKPHPPISAVILGLVWLALAMSARAAEPVAKQRMIEESRAVASGFIQRLGGEVKKAYGAKGPDAALKVCTELAPMLAAELSSQHGWRISRVSLKPRNIILGTPDAWEQRVLSVFEQRAFQGENPANIEFGDVVNELNGKSFRYMKALTMQEMCLACHGPVEKIPPEVRQRLNVDYPHDKGVGYLPGQIRGAVTIKRPLAAD